MSGSDRVERQRWLRLREIAKEIARLEREASVLLRDFGPTWLDIWRTTIDDAHRELAATNDERGGQ